MLVNEDSCTSLDSEEIFSSSSYDRSSIGSIPWAEDAIKQNQHEWEHIERMFYGEEELPQEVDLRNEILEWRRMFPHLRINGKKLKISKFSSNPHKTSLLENIEEIFISHPHNKVLNLKTNADVHLEKNELRNEETKDRIIKELEKNLRINSVPIISRNRTLIKGHKQDIKKQEGSTPLIHIVRHESKCKDIKSSPIFKSFNNEEISNSARTLRMPPIMNVIVPQNYLTNSPIKNNSSGKSAILLPKIPSEKNFRSISAAVSHRTLSDYLLLPNTLKFKCSK